MTRQLTDQDKRDIYDSIRQFLSDELDAPVDSIGPETRIIDDLKGDSMIYLELVEDFKKKYNVKVEIALIGRYLQRHPVFTVGQTAQAVYDIVERGDRLLSDEAEPRKAGPA